MARRRVGCTVNDLLTHLCTMRDGLIAKMAAQLEIGGDVTGWLPLLAQTQAAIEAVEAAMKESLSPAGMGVGAGGGVGRVKPSPCKTDGCVSDKLEVTL